MHDWKLAATKLSGDWAFRGRGAHCVHISWQSVRSQNPGLLSSAGSCHTELTGLVRYSGERGNIVKLCQVPLNCNKKHKTGLLISGH